MAKGARPFVAPSFRRPFAATALAEASLSADLHKPHFNSLPTPSIISLPPFPPSLTHLPRLSFKLPRLIVRYPFFLTSHTAPLNLAFELQQHLVSFPEPVHLTTSVTTTLPAAFPPKPSSSIHCTSSPSDSLIINFCLGLPLRVPAIGSLLNTSARGHLGARGSK